MHERRCPVCGSEDDSVVVVESEIDPERIDRHSFSSRKKPEYMHYRLVECPQCDLVYANPAPEEGLLAEAYRHAAYDSAEEAAHAARTYAGLLKPIMSRLPGMQGALDIGAGDGAFLEHLVFAGFSEVVGVEPSRAPRLSARQGVRDLIREGIFRPGDFGDRRFSLITCFQTLEHLYQPGEMCGSANSMLVEGGALLVVCHNRRSVSARLLGRRSPIYDIEHLQLFSPQSLRYLLESNGFRDVKISVLVNRYPLGYWVKIAPLPGRAKSILLRALEHASIGSWPISLPAGNMAAVGYRR